MRSLALIGALAAASLGGCAADLDLSDKPCPCAPGWLCVSGLCVNGSDGQPGRITVGDLRSDWQTPNVIHWRWSIAGDPTDFAELQLVVAETQEDVLERGPTARVFDQESRPALGAYYRRRTGGDDDAVESVHTDGHEPSTRYFAQLVAFDTGGHITRSNVAMVTTQAPPIDGLVLFDDGERIGGYGLPADSWAVSDERPFAGERHLTYTHPCPSGAACYDNARRHDLGLGPLAYSGGTHALAYLEMRVAIDGTVAADWCEIGLHLTRVEGGGRDNFGLQPVVPLADGEYHLLQVPLTALGSGRLTYERATATTVDGFRIGCNFVAGTRVHIDEVAIRW